MCNMDICILNCMKDDVPSWSGGEDEHTLNKTDLKLDPSSLYSIHALGQVVSFSAYFGFLMRNMGVRKLRCLDK